MRPVHLFTLCHSTVEAYGSSLTLARRDLLPPDLRRADDGALLDLEPVRYDNAEVPIERVGIRLGSVAGWEHQALERYGIEPARDQVYLAMEPELRQLLSAPFRAELAQARVELAQAQAELSQVRVELGKARADAKAQRHEARQQAQAWTMLRERVWAWEDLPLWRRLWAVLRGESIC